MWRPTLDTISVAFQSQWSDDFSAHQTSSIRWGSGLVRRISTSIGLVSSKAKASMVEPFSCWAKPTFWTSKLEVRWCTTSIPVGQALLALERERWGTEMLDGHHGRFCQLVIGTSAQIRTEKWSKWASGPWGCTSVLGLCCSRRPCAKPFGCIPMNLDWPS